MRLRQMVQQATVSGGMLPKLEACTSALKKGVTRVRILACGAGRSSARILYPSHRLRHRGDCVVNHLNHLVLHPTERKEGAWPGPRFDRALERRC